MIKPDLLTESESITLTHLRGWDEVRVGPRDGRRKAHGNKKCATVRTKIAYGIVIKDSTAKSGDQGLNGSPSAWLIPVMTAKIKTPSRVMIRMIGVFAQPSLTAVLRLSAVRVRTTTWVDTSTHLRTI